MSELQAEIQRLVEPNLRKRLYVAFSYPVASVEETMPHIPEHIHYLLEHEDKVFLSGPFVTEGHIVGEGMTVLYAATEKEAAAFMDNEPFIKRGRAQAVGAARGYAVHQNASFRDTVRTRLKSRLQSQRTILQSRQGRYA